MLLNLFCSTLKRNIGVATPNGARQFNTGTLLNVRRYLLEKNKTIIVEKNESGFFRVIIDEKDIPTILTDDKRAALPAKELATIKAVRLNFWKLGNTEHNLGDASIHCHPRNFKSYIISGSYRSENYKECASQEGAGYFKFELNKSKARVTFLGVRHLVKTDDVNPQEGDLVFLHDTQIHRVKEYNVTGKNTLTINTVFQQGKGINYVYMSDKQRESVRLSREILSPSERLATIEDIVDTLDNKIRKSFLKLR